MSGLNFRQEVKDAWSFRSGEEVEKRRRRFRYRLYNVLDYIDEDKFIVDSDREAMQAVRAKCNKILSCGSTVNETLRRCDCPLLCEYCLNLRKAEVLQCLLDYLDEAEELYAIVETGSYSFLRGVYHDGCGYQILNNTPRSICDNLDLSVEQDGMKYSDFQDAFNDTLYLIKETQGLLVDWKSSLRMKYRQRKNYLGGVMSLYHYPTGLHTCSVCSSNLFFFESLPKDEPMEDQENRSMGTIYTTHRMSREIYQLTGDKDYQNGSKEVVPLISLGYFLNQNLKVRFPWLLRMGTEELAYHLSTLSGIKTLQRVGPIFSKISD